MNKPNRSEGSVEQRRQYSRDYSRNIPLELKAATMASWRTLNPEKRKATVEKHEAKKLKALEDLAGRKKPENCELCGALATGSRRGSSVKINWDHDHVTGLFRGWLCTQCNMAIGLVKDSPGRLRKMADYIENGGISINPTMSQVDYMVERILN